ncbi:MAG: hypothetical protein RR513_05005 [Muribaculaceae bacterium]
MLSYFSLLNDVKEHIPAYLKFLKKELGHENIPADFTQLPLENKHNYLLEFPMNELSRPDDMQHFHLIGASSGFSKTGAVYWPKRPCDEAGYMQSIETMFDVNYNIGEKRTLVLECLAFGMWIGGMQIAAALRNIAISGKYPLTLATPGLDLKAAVRVIHDYKDMFSQILVITNPSNISLFSALLNEQNIKLPDGMISFPVVGEYFSESFREHICRRYGHNIDSPYVVWTGYGSADTGDIGAETAGTIALRKLCYRDPKISKELFGMTSAPMILALSSNVYLEVINGNLVVTKDQFIPLIRYNTGDAGGLLYKSNLAGKVPQSIIDALPDEMVYVFGRADNAIIFYGTNLMVNDISEHLLSLPSDKCYGGLFTVHENEENGITSFNFTIYVTNMEYVDEKWYLDSLIHFLSNQSAEFNIKFSNLSQSVDVPLITVSIADIKCLDTKIKHRYII